MYRLLPVTKDTYITNKIIHGSGSTTSNVGQAATLDLFKVYTVETSGSAPTVELSRLLLQVDLAGIRSLTGSLVSLTDPSFKCLLNLRDIYGGQTCPSNFTVTLNPLSKSWDEGRGRDIKEFRDLDSTNWITASVTSGAPSPWTITGANDGASDYLSGWAVQQTFTTGNEDLLMDVTSIVSATLAGIIPDKGWRISFSSSLEDDENSYFVKRFGSRHTVNQRLHPKLIFTFDDTLQDDGNQAVFGQNNKIRTYNSVNGQYTNFVSASTSVTGSGSLKLVMVASKSITVSTSSYFQNFSASITYNSSSVSYFSASFTGSQSTFGGNALTGFYEANVSMDPQLTASLASFLVMSKSLTFQTYWTSLDGTVLYSSGAYLTFKLPESGEQVVSERNFIVNVTNLKPEYTQAQVSRLKVFIQDFNTELPAFRLPTKSKSKIFKRMYWRLLNAFTREVVIPYHANGTKLSSDGFGMYFDLYASDLDPQTVYEIEFQITENDRDYFITGEGFRFKVIP